MFLCKIWIQCRRNLRRLLRREGLNKKDKLAVMITLGKSQGTWCNKELYKTVSGLISNGYYVTFDLGGADDSYTALQKLITKAKKVQGKRIIELPQLDKRCLMALLSCADIVLSIETGPMHLAVALNKPTIGIIPGSLSRFDWASPRRAANFIAIRGPEINKITSEQILKEIQRF